MRDEGISISSQLLTPLIDFGEPEEKRTRRKPNFTVQERMHLAQSYVESYEEYNRASYLSATELAENYSENVTCTLPRYGKKIYFALISAISNSIDEVVKN